MSEKSEKLVTILATGDPGLIAVAKSLLEGAGIRFVVKGEGVQNLFGTGGLGTGFNPITGPSEFQVSAEDEAQARELLGALKEGGAKVGSNSQNKSKSSKNKLGKFIGLCLVGIFLVGFWVFLELRKEEEKNFASYWKDYQVEGLQAFKAGDYSKAEKYFKKSVLIAQQHQENIVCPKFSVDNLANSNVTDCEEFSREPEFRLAASYSNLLKTYQKEGELDLLREWVAKIPEKSLGDQKISLRGLILGNLAISYLKEENISAAEPFLKEIVPNGENPSSLAIGLANLAVYYDKKHEYQAGELLHRRVLDIREQHFGPETPEVALALFGLALNLQNQNKMEEVEPLLKRALEIQEKALGVDSPVLVPTLVFLADNESFQNHYPEAEALLLRALHILEKTPEENGPHLASLQRSLATFYLNHGETAKAEAFANQAIALQEKTSPIDELDLAKSLLILAEIYRKNEDYVKAAPLYQRVLQIRERKLEANSPDIAKALMGLASNERDEGKFSEAENHFQRAIEIRNKSPGVDDTELANALRGLAETYRREKKFQDAEPLFQEALAKLQKAPENSSTLTVRAVTLEDQAKLFSDEGKDSEAQPLFQQAIQLEEKSKGPSHPELAKMLDDYAHFLRKANPPQTVEAANLEARAKQIRSKQGK